MGEVGRCFARRRFGLAEGFGRVPLLRRVAVLPTDLIAAAESAVVTMIGAAVVSLRSHKCPSRIRLVGLQKREAMAKAAQNQHDGLRAEIGPDERSDHPQRIVRPFHADCSPHED